MKRVITLLLSSVWLTSASLQGKRDVKVNGFKSPRRRNRYILSSDFGIGENILGLTANYLLSVNEDALGNIPDFGQRVDLKARFNANLGNVLKLEPNMDVYPLRST
jgi:hypothetical protein